MAPNKTELPEEIVDVYRIGFDNLVRADIHRRDELRTAPLAAIPVFTLTLSDVLLKRSDTESTGWRLLVGGAEGTERAEPALAEVALRGSERKPRLVSFSKNKQNAEFFQRYKQILTHERLINDQGFELRFLRIPAIAIDAFWLHAADGRNDVVVPIRAPAGLNKANQYPLEEFFLALPPIVGEFLAFDKETV